MKESNKQFDDVKDSLHTEALKLADELEDEAKYGECDWTSPRVSATMIRRLLEERDKFIKVLEEIANDYPELSHDKARMQNLDHIKWAKEVLK